MRSRDCMGACGRQPLPRFFARLRSSILALALLSTQLGSCDVRILSPTFDTFPIYPNRPPDYFSYPACVRGVVRGAGLQASPRLVVSQVPERRRSVRCWRQRWCCVNRPSGLAAVNKYNLRLYHTRIRLLLCRSQCQCRRPRTALLPRPPLSSVAPSLPRCFRAERHPRRHLGPLREHEQLRAVRGRRALRRPLREQRQRRQHGLHVLGRPHQVSCWQL